MTIDSSIVVEIDYNDLIEENCDISTLIGRAFGIDGIGVLTVKNVPNYPSARKRLLPLSREFALLSDDVKAKYIHKESFYSFGWSHGIEKLQGNPDLAKGSYYANPQFDKPIDDEQLIKQYPAFIHPNIWPKDDLPELEYAFKDLGNIIVSVGKLVAKQCDKYVLSSCPSYVPNHLETVIEDSKCCKARLLHYFPLSNEDITNKQSAASDTLFSSWCGW